MFKQTYGELLDCIKSNGWNILPLKKFKDCPITDKVIGLRHDVDIDLNLAINMAEFEVKQGISSTYFFLHTAKYYEDVPDCLPLFDKHEVGLHLDLFQVLQDKSLPHDFLLRELGRFRKLGVSIVGVSSHGSDLSKRAYHQGKVEGCHYFREYGRYLLVGVPGDKSLSNQLFNCFIGVFGYYGLSEYGLEYSARKLDMQSYISDATDGQGLFKIEWDVEYPSDVYIASDLNSFLSRAKNKTQLLIHPVWWSL